jgi:hypothetical protein
MAATKHVRWKDEEREKVAIHAMTLFNTSGYRWLEALYQANAMMPPDRQRPKTSLNTDSPKLRDLGYKLYHATKVQESTGKPANEIIESLAEPKVIVDPLEEAMKLIVDRFTDAIGPLLKPALVKILKSTMTEAITEVAEAAPELIEKFTHPKPMDYKPRVLIIGLIGVQPHRVKDEFGKDFQLLFHETDDNIHHLKDRMGSVDFVIINTKKINHSIYQVAKKHHSLIQVHGDVSSILRRLEMLKREGK